MDTHWCILALRYLGALDRVNRDKTVAYALRYYRELLQYYRDTSDEPALGQLVYAIRPLYHLNALNAINKT